MGGSRNAFLQHVWSRLSDFCSTLTSVCLRFSLCKRLTLWIAFEKGNAVISTKLSPPPPKKCLSRQVPSHNLFLAFHKQPQVWICCVYGRPKICLFTFFLPLWSVPRNTEEFNYMVTGALTWPRFCFNHPTVRYKEVQGRLCYVCVCAWSGQWAMQWHQRAQWDRDRVTLILVDLYENLRHTSRIRLSLKMFK